MASTVPSSTQNTWSWMIWLCAYSAGIGPVTPITWSVGWFRYWWMYSLAPTVCWPNEVPGWKYRNVMIVVECSAVPTSRPAVFGSANAPARPGMSLGVPELVWPGLAVPARPAVFSPSALASASSTPAASAARES